MDAQSIVKKRQPSRKSKRAWRKNVDIAAVETSLAEIETEKRQHGAPLHIQPDHAIFVIDRAGDPQFKVSSRKSPCLRIDQILASRTKTPCITSRLRQEPSQLSTRSRKKSLLNGRKLKGEALLVQKLVEKVNRAKNGGIAKRERTGTKGLISRGVKGSNSSSNSRNGDQQVLGERIQSPWDEEDELDVLEIDLQQKEYVEPTLPKPVKKPKTIAQAPQTHISSSIALPDPGASYNPTFDDHQALLRKAVDEEEERMARIENVKKKLLYPPELDLLDDETFFGNDDDDGEDDEEETATRAQPADETGPMIKASTSAENRKTRKQRAAQAKRANDERGLEKKRLEKKIIKEINQLTDMKKKIKKQTDESESKSMEPQKIHNKPHRLGRHKLKPRLIDVQLTHELSDSLRQLKPEGNTFQDLFIGIQKRELIEPRKRVGARKKKIGRVKYFESHDYKRFK